MPLEKIVLDNGARLYLDRVRDETVALAITFRVGSALEPREKRGLAHLTEHMLFRSNERYSSRDIDRGFELCGGEANAYTSRDAMTIVFEVLAPEFRRVLDIVRWMITGRRVDPREFEMERNIVLQEIAEAESNPKERIYDLIYTALYGKSDLGDPIHGYRETVEAIEPRDIVWFKECFFAGSVTHAVLTGGFSREHVELVKRLLSMLDPKPCTLRTPSREPPRDVREYSSEAKQAYVAIVFEPNDSDEKLSLARFMLADGATSILFEKLRSEKGLVYSFNVVYDYMPWTRLFAIVLEGVDDVEEARRALIESLDALDFLDDEYVEGRKRYFRFITRPSKLTMYTRALIESSLVSKGFEITFEERRKLLLAMDWRRLKPSFLKPVFAEILPGGQPRL